MFVLLLHRFLSFRRCRHVGRFVTVGLRFAHVMHVFVGTENYDELVGIFPFCRVPDFWSRWS